MNKMLRYASGLCTRGLAVLVTLWLFTHAVYVVDEAYRSALRSSWRLRHGSVEYKPAFTLEQMVELHGQRKSDYLGNILRIEGDERWRGIEEGLENSLMDMFDRKDKMKGWEIKKIGADAWHEAYRRLKELDSVLPPPTPFINSKNEEDVDMSNILVYNRVAKSGSSLLMSMIYKLREKLGYLVLRGKYHSYRYFRDNDRKGLGHFLEQGSSRARMVYIQHQYYINYTEFHIDQPRYINMVRDPLDQFISWYFYTRTAVLYHRSPANMTVEERKTIGQSLEECVVERRLECVYYGYTTPKNKTNQLDFRKNWNPDFFHPNDVMLHFCGHAPECASLGNPLALQRAKYNVENHFTVVGVLEHLQESAAVLEHLLPEFFKGVSELVAEEGVVNQNTVKKDDLPTSVRDTLKHRFKDLYDLYGFIKQRLFKQYNKIKSSKIKSSKNSKP